MAKKGGTARGGTSKAGTSLGLSIFLIVALLVVATTASGIVAVRMGRDAARAGIAGELRRVHAAQALLQQKRLRQLELVSLRVSEAPWVAAALAAAAEANVDEEALTARIGETAREYGLDMVVLVDREGRALAGAAGDLAGDPLLASLLDGQQKKNAVGLWSLGGTLHQAVVVRVVRNFELLGFLGVGSSLAPLAGEIARATGAETLLFADSPTGPAVVGSSIAAQRAGAVIAALRREGQALTRVQRGETVEGAEIELDGEPWIAFLAPLKDIAEKPVGATVGLTTVAARLAGFDRMLQILAAAGGAALVLGLLLSFLVGRRALAPVNRLARAAAEIAGGNYEATLPPARGTFAPLIHPLGHLARRLSDKASLETFLEKVGRELPEPARKETAGAPQTRELALVAVEMRRFANPKLGYDPEENVGRLARDLRRIADTVTARQGTVEAVYGHRILAAFEGEGNALRALAAATEILLLLTTRENAFDEPVPPVVALTLGSVVTGSVRWGTRTDRAVAGLPVQQLESVMREAPPGDLYFSKPFAQEIHPTVQRAGVQLQAQRGLMSPQPLYQLTADAACRVTGAEPPPSEPRSVTQVTTLADVVPGEVVGRRFEVLAEIGAGPSGAVFKCRDRDRGDLVRLKVLRPEVMKVPARVERLKQALDQARLIAHPEVLGVHDFGQSDGLGFVASPFVRAMTLRFVIGRGKSTPVPLAPAFLLSRRIVDGLRAAHRQKLVHGGLKPENVLVEPTGGVKVTDFGFAAPLEAAARDAPFAGAAYLAPEQIAGRPAGPQSDVYAWGVVFYELATGQVPAAGGSPSQVAANLQQQGVEPPSVRCAEMPPKLEAILLRCLEVDPGKRYGSFDELARDLDALRA